MRLHRLLGIIMLLDSTGTISAGKLAEILETSERTIYRDIDILCEAGIPIVSISGPRGGYSFMENFKINSNNLGKLDVLNLLLQGMGVKSEKNSEASKQLHNIISKLESGLSKENREKIVKAKERFFVDSDPWFGKRSENKYIDIIKDSVMNLKKIKVYYKKYLGEASERILRPYGVVVKNDQWYMAAFCESKNETRIFKCSRLESVQVLEEGFIIPEGFSLERFWESSKEQFVLKPENKEYKGYIVKIKLQDESYMVLKGFNICSSIKTGDYQICDVDMISFETACSVIFPLSHKIEVLEPLILRKFIIEKTNKILALYKSLT
ncbi:MAG: helix-turn-helix transcriptional regulator [Solirubrobacterales bacterium]